MQHQEAVETLASERYLLGEMNEAERDSFEAHYFTCVACAEDVRTGATLRDGVRAGLAKVAPAKRSWSPVWRPAIAIPWAAAATLALMAGYQSMHTAAPASFSAALPLAPMTLRAATRGQEATVTAGQGGLVTLAIDLGGQRFEGGLTYELRQADGTRVTDGQTAAPPAGAPLMLVLPAGLARANGHYVLLVHDSRNVGLTPEEYRFSVGAQ
jgi:anti-sigma factor RsiW